jgi:hypothetical protein
LDATHNRVNDAVFTLDDQDLIVGTGSPGDTLTSISGAFPTAFAFSGSAHIPTERTV